MADAPVLDSAGPAAPPRRNGELVFAAPWESRVFGITLALHAAGRFEWEAFRRRLVAALAAADADPTADAAAGYWACWLRALEGLLAERGLCPPDAVNARVVALTARPPGHDHTRRP